MPIPSGTRSTASPGFISTSDDSREWVFYTDKRGFQERLNLARDRNLQGFCSWVLGTEDPEIWTLLPSHK